MDTILSQQHINHRRLSSPLTRTQEQKPILYKLSGYASPTSITAIEQVKQKPVHGREYYKKEAGSVVGRLSRPISTTPSRFAMPALSSLSKTIPQVQEQTVPGQQTPVLPVLLIIIALGGVVVFAFLALNWQQGLLTSFFGGAYRLAPGADKGIEQNLVAYTGLSTPAPLTQDIPLNLVETFAWESYVVQKGDSISKIAVNHAISMDAIIASNNIANAKLLRERDILRIPNMDGIPYTVKKGDSLSKIAAGMGVPLEVILDVNDIQSETINPGAVMFIPGAKMRSEDMRLVLGDLFIYPIRGRLTSPFGWRKDPITGVRRYHAAVDLAAGTGTPIKAAMEGKISSVGLNSVYGKYIIISHSRGYQTMYAHLSVISVTQGASVSQGAKIGEVGSTGYSTGPHLHFALYKNGRAVNPLDYLNS
ncbi:MAG: M23 family metallopeptidase [Treponema sp.]|jgi:murein DD-endopeptidase MepM/ murein hydrolase activator NlpD|nr:M23 family metallopeptidase [Treponema sp.]